MGFKQKNYVFYQNSNISINHIKAYERPYAQIDYNDARCYKNPSNPPLIWDFVQGISTLSVGCHVISIPTIRLNECVLIVEMCIKMKLVEKWVMMSQFNKDNRRKFLAQLVQQSQGLANKVMSQNGKDTKQKPSGSSPYSMKQGGVNKC